MEFQTFICKQEDPMCTGCRFQEKTIIPNHEEYEQQILMLCSLRKIDCHQRVKVMLSVTPKV
jgi:hypothetical protein